MEILEWDTLEYESGEKNADWFWLIGAITIVIITISIFFKNILLAVIMVIGVLTIIIYEFKAPKIIKVKLSNKGIQIRNELYPYEKIKSFWIDQRKDYKSPILIIHYDRLVFPSIHLHLGSMPVEQVRDYLLEHLEEQEHEPSFSEAVADFFGF